MPPESSSHPQAARIAAWISFTALTLLYLYLEPTVLLRGFAICAFLSVIYLGWSEGGLPNRVLCTYCFAVLALSGRLLIAYEAPLLFIVPGMIAEGAFLSHLLLHIRPTAALVTGITVAEGVALLSLTPVGIYMGGALAAWLAILLGLWYAQRSERDSSPAQSD
jgi:uncharacterized membrane protein YccC